MVQSVKWTSTVFNISTPFGSFYILFLKKNLLLQANSFSNTCDDFFIKDKLFLALFKGFTLYIYTIGSSAEKAVLQLS